MSQTKESSESNILHRKGSSFREYVQRQVDESRISFVESNFGSIHHGSSFAQPQTSPEKGDSLLVTSSGTIMQQTKERHTGTNSLYDVDVNKENEEDEERSEDESEIDSEERMEDGGETLVGDEEEKKVKKRKRKVITEKEKNDEEEREGDEEEKSKDKERSGDEEEKTVKKRKKKVITEKEIDDGEEREGNGEEKSKDKEESGDEEEKTVKKRKKKVITEKEKDDGEEREGDGDEKSKDKEGSGDEDEKTVKKRKKKVITEKENDDGEETEGDEEEKSKDEEVESGEERMENVEEKIGDEKETVDDKEKVVEEGERTSDVEEKSSDKQEEVGDVEEKVVVEEKVEKAGEEEKEERNELKEEEDDDDKSGKEQEKQVIEQRDDEQEVGKEDKGEDQKEIREDQETETPEEDEKTDEEEDEDEEKEGPEMGEEGQEIITRAVQSKDDAVSFELGSEIKAESISSSIEHEKLTERLKQINFELSYVNRKNRFLTKAVLDIRGKKADIDAGESKLTEGYLKKLVNFEKIKFSIQNEMKKITDQVDVLRERSKIATEIYEAAQEEFLKKIDDAYKKLDSNFGSLASEKTIVQPTHRIQTALANVSKMRLQMVKLQNHLAEKEAQLQSLDDRQDGLHLIDYEKLKMHNQHLIETIAERDLELLRLRKKIETDTQKLAHVRERAKIIGEENRDYHATLEELDAQIKLAREDVNNKKQRRQRIAVETRKMRQDAGLLTKPKLVTSFRQTELDLEAAKNQFNDIMQVYQQQKKKIIDLKERLNSSTEFPKIIKD